MWARLQKEEPALMASAQIFSYNQPTNSSKPGTGLDTGGTVNENVITIKSPPGSIISSVKISNRGDSLYTGATRII